MHAFLWSFTVYDKRVVGKRLNIKEKHAQSTRRFLVCQDLNFAADQRLCFRYIDSTVHFLSKCKAISCGCTAWFCRTWSETPKTIFSRRGSIFRTWPLYLCKKSRSRFLLHKNNVHLKSVHHFLCEISSSYTKSNGHLTVHSRKIIDSFTIGWRHRYILTVIMWFLFGEVSSSSGCLGWAMLFYCGTPWAFI